MTTHCTFTLTIFFQTREGGEICCQSDDFVLLDALARQKPPQIRPHEAYILDLPAIDAVIAEARGAASDPALARVLPQLETVRDSAARDGFVVCGWTL
jgi:hypothetical protein